MRIDNLKKRLKILEEKHAPWIDNDDDGMLTAVGALPGENYLDALRRQAPIVWQGYDSPEATE